MKLVWTFAIVAITALNYGKITGAPLTKWFKTDHFTYYIEEQEKFNWRQSYDECQKKFMALITLKAYKEDELLLKYITQSYDSKPEFWLKASDQVDLKDINKLLGSMMAAEFLNIQLDGVNDPHILQSNSADNCALTAEGTVKACESLHGFICYRNDTKANGGQNIQNIVLQFS